MTDRLRIGRASLLQHRPDQIDATAWRLVFVAGDDVCRACVRAESVVNAGVEDFFRLTDSWLFELLRREQRLHFLPLPLTG